MSRSALKAAIWSCLGGLAALPAIGVSETFEIAADVRGRLVVAATVTPQYVACAAAVGQPAQFVLDTKNRQLWLVSQSRESKAAVSTEAFQQWVAFRAALSQEQLARERQALKDEHIDQRFRYSLKEAESGKLETHAIGRPVVQASAGAQHINQLVPLEQSLASVRASIDGLGTRQKYIPQVFTCFLKATEVPFVAHLAKKGAPDVFFTKRASITPLALDLLRTVPLWAMFVSDPALVQSLAASK